MTKDLAGYLFGGGEGRSWTGAVNKGVGEGAFQVNNVERVEWKEGWTG